MDPTVVLSVTDTTHPLARGPYMYKRTIETASTSTPGRAGKRPQLRLGRGRRACAPDESSPEPEFHLPVAAQYHDDRTVTVPAVR